MSRKNSNTIRLMKEIRKLYDKNTTNIINKNTKLAELTKMNEKHITANFTKKEKEQYNLLLDSVRDYNSRIEKNNDKIDRLDELLEEELDKTGSLDFTKGGKKRKAKKQTRKKQKGGVAPDRNRRSNRNRRNFLSIPASPDESRNRTHEHEDDDEFATRLTDSFRPFSSNIQYISTPSESSDASDDNIIPPLESVNSNEIQIEYYTQSDHYQNITQDYVNMILNPLEISQEDTRNMVKQSIVLFMRILEIINHDIRVNNSIFETLENKLYDTILLLSTVQRRNLNNSLRNTIRRYINRQDNISHQQQSDIATLLAILVRFRVGRSRTQYIVPDNTDRTPREIGGKIKKN